MEKTRGVQKHEVYKSDMFDLRVDFCHLDPKSRANHLEYFRTLNVTGLGLRIAKNLRRGYTLAKHVACLTLELTFVIWTPNQEPTIWSTLGHQI